MVSEIGSNFWRYSFESKARKEKMWWESEMYNHFWFKSGRNATKALARSIKTKPAKILLPIYTCETVIQPFLDEGWKVDYYHLNQNLSIDIDFMLKKCDAFMPTAMLFHSYFGFDTICGDEDVIDQLHNRGITIIEDITQSVFSSHFIGCADYYVLSLRKFLAIPDGGIVFSKKKLSFDKIDDSDPALVQTAIQAFGLKKTYMEENQNETIKLEFRKKYQELNRMIADNTTLQHISSESRSIFNASDTDFIKQKRVQNYLQLIRTIEKLHFLHPVMDQSLEGVTPLYLPAYVECNRKKLQNCLAQNNVYCPVIWPKPPQIEIRDSVTDYMYDHMLCFPIDQRYGIEEMEKISNLLRNYKEQSEEHDG